MQYHDCECCTEKMHSQIFQKIIDLMKSIKSSIHVLVCEADLAILMLRVNSQSVVMLKIVIK